MKIRKTLAIRLQNKKLRYSPIQRAMVQAQTLMAKYNSKKISLSDKLLAERHHEAFCD
jgi:hypothetical protein